MRPRVLGVVFCSESIKRVPVHQRAAHATDGFSAGQSILMQRHVPSRSGAICRYADGLVRAKIDAYGCDASSMPAIVTAALANDLKPFIEAHRRLIARWSCSMMLFRYFELRTLTRRHTTVLASQESQRPVAWYMAIEGDLAWSSIRMRGERLAKERLPSGNA